MSVREEDLALYRVISLCNKNRDENEFIEDILRFKWSPKHAKTQIAFVLEFKDLTQQEAVSVFENLKRKLEELSLAEESKKVKKELEEVNCQIKKIIELLKM